jgi:hypothetical protein
LSDNSTDLECFPVEILPQGIPIKDYDIRFDKSSLRVNEIRHRQFGLIKFNSYKIDEMCGYVRGSITRVYTHLFRPEMLNIVHIHINDTSEQVTIDVAYMQDGQSLKDFEEFKADYTG